MTVKEKDARYIAGTYARFPVTLVRGSGAELFDDGGRRYIDMGSGIGVNIFGAADPEWTAAVSAQLGTLAHASNLYFTEPCVRVAEKLALKSGMKNVFFAGSGADGKLEEGDVLLTANGADLRTIDDLMAVRDGLQAGNSINFQVRRGEDTLTVAVELMEQYQLEG